MVGVPTPVGSLSGKKLTTPTVSGFSMFLDPYHATRSGGLISALPDQSANNYSWQQSTDANKPIFIHEGLNGKPGMLFDGVSSVLDDDGNGAFGITDLLTASAYTAFIVFKPILRSGANDTATDVSNKAALIGDSGGGFGFHTGATTAGHMVYDGAYDTVTDTITFGTVYGAEMRLESGTAYLTMSGGTEQSTVMGPATAGGADVQIGRASGLSLYYPGVIGTIVTYQTALSSGDRSTMRTWVADNYDITW